MIDCVMLYQGPAIGLYEYKNFKEFMIGLRDSDRAVVVPFHETLEGKLNQTYHVHPGVTLHWTEKKDNKEHCLVSLYGATDNAKEVIKLFMEMERIHQYLRALDSEKLRKL